MGVYIKGMEMPKRGHTITITIVGSGQAYVEYFDCRPHVEETIEYTAIPVPPHGDLVDRREAIIDANERAYDFWLSDDEVNSTIQFLNEQAAVIPAEPGEEDE